MIMPLMKLPALSEEEILQINDQDLHDFLAFPIFQRDTWLQPSSFIGPQNEQTLETFIQLFRRYWQTFKGSSFMNSPKIEILVQLFNKPTLTAHPLGGQLLLFLLLGSGQATEIINWLGNPSTFCGWVSYLEDLNRHIREEVM
ncbi:hypothetical protein PSAB_19950 [Paenibacillus sabinae T27]|uniref:Uncharacterized protein n=2 Tax=Paenibacillus sabinae TaxID=365617 RepID=X4ZHA9_9BACL|nr:hypothetical protein PSAB_19950 [Paenibacillus sabinae T27]